LRTARLNAPLRVDERDETDLDRIAFGERRLHDAVRLRS